MRSSRDGEFRRRLQETGGLEEEFRRWEVYEMESCSRMAPNSFVSEAQYFSITSHSDADSECLSCIVLLRRKRLPFVRPL